MNVCQLKFLDRLLRTCVRRLPRKRPKQSLTSPTSILVIKLSAMGDALCLMPSVRMLSQAFPEATIDWLTTHRSQPSLFARIPFLNKIYLLPTDPISLLWFLAQFILRLRSYRLIIDYDQYYQISEILAYFGKVNAGFHTSLKGNTFAIQEKYQPLRNEKFQFRALTEQVTKQWDHTVLKFEHILSELLHDFTPSPKLQEAVDALRAAKKPVLVLYPGSSINASFRRWDLTNYIRLIQEYQDQYTVVVAGGSDETELKKLLNYSVYHALDWINKWSLIEWGWIFKNTASIFIGNDGGLLHLADSQDVPTVGVFGPALYRKWGSISKKSTGVEIDLECRPCLQNYIGIVPQQCHRGDLACLQRIEVHQVISAINSIVSKVNLN